MRRERRRMKRGRRKKMRMRRKMEMRSDLADSRLKEEE